MWLCWRATLEFLNLSGDVSCVEDVEKLVADLHQARLCAGGPSVTSYPNVHPASAFVDVAGRWRHKQCALLLKDGESACSHCQCLVTTLRIHEKRMLDKTRDKRRPRYIRLTTARNSNVLAFRRAQYALKKSVDRLAKRVQSLNCQLKDTQAKLSRISDEALEEKLSGLHIPEAQPTAIKVHCSCQMHKQEKQTLH